MSVELNQALNRVKQSRIIWRKCNPLDVQAVKSSYAIYRENVKAYNTIKRAEAKKG